MFWFGRNVNWVAMLVLVALPSVSLIMLQTWGPPKIQCFLSLLIAPEETEELCAQAYPDTWRKEEGDARGQGD